MSRYIGRTTISLWGLGGRRGFRLIAAAAAFCAPAVLAVGSLFACSSGDPSPTASSPLAAGSSNTSMPPGGTTVPNPNAVLALPTTLRGQDICPAGPFAALPLPAAAAPTPVALTGAGAGPFAHLDGPVWLAGPQRLALSAWPQAAGSGQGPASVLLQIAAGGATTIAAPLGTYGSNGLAVDAQGVLWAALHDRQQVASLQPAQGGRTPLAGSFAGRPFNTPNDLTLRRDGNVYITDPNYQQEGRPGQPVTGIYRITPAGSVELIDGSRDQPNGIALSLDEATLYVGGNDQRILAYPVAADGSVGPSTPFIEAGDNVDGMVLDCAGNIYAVLYSRQTVQVWSPSGSPLASLTLPEPATNLAFGGEDRLTLYISALTRLYTVRGLVPGLPY